MVLDWSKLEGLLLEEPILQELQRDLAGRVACSWLVAQLWCAPVVKEPSASLELWVQEQPVC